MKEKYLVVIIKEDNFDEVWDNIKDIKGVKDSLRLSTYGYRKLESPF
tara:strand:- start:364 stop:504 length:141 start_codon:yes stop_codon:yes gene_type:complete